jgi:hypothetical protein
MFSKVGESPRSLLPDSNLGLPPPSNVDAAPSIFQTSDGRFFVISTSGRDEFGKDQYFQTPDGRLFKISAMAEEEADMVRHVAEELSAAAEEEEDDDDEVPDLTSVLIQGRNRTHWCRNFDV